MENLNQKQSQTWLSCKKSLRRAFLLFCGILVFGVIYLRRTTVINNIIPGIRDGLHSKHNETEQLNSFSSKEPDEKMRHFSKKIFIAFNYWEQLSAGTNNIFDLTALAAYGGRQVVVPFVKDSKFHGSPTEKSSKTLALYYNVTALNHTLRSRGHGTLISWKEFQDVCQGKLDVLVYLDYKKAKKTTKYSRAKRPFFHCNSNQWNTSADFKVERTICMNVFAVDSVEKFENEVVKRLPCVGLAQWRGNKRKNRFRAQFQLSPLVTHRMHYQDAAVFFNSKLLNVAQDFIAKKLGPIFLAVHIRAERIPSTSKNITKVTNCISNLSTLIQRHKNVSSTAHIPVFLAADFADYGSSSRHVEIARKNATSLMKIVTPLKPVLFQPSAYNLTDRGAVAIVEMNILLSGKHLFVVGEGKFQKWIVNKFLHKNNIDKRSKVKCRSKMCKNLCYF